MYLRVNEVSGITFNFGLVDGEENVNCLTSRRILHILFNFFLFLTYNFNYIVVCTVRLVKLNAQTMYKLPDSALFSVRVWRFARLYLVRVRHFFRMGNRIG